MDVLMHSMLSIPQSWAQDLLCLVCEKKVVTVDTFTVFGACRGLFQVACHSLDLTTLGDRLFVIALYSGYSRPRRLSTLYNVIGSGAGYLPAPAVGYLSFATTLAVILAERSDQPICPWLLRAGCRAPHRVRRGNDLSEVAHRSQSPSCGLASAC